MKKLLLILLCLPLLFSCGEKKADKVKKLEDRIAELEKNKDEGNLPKEIAEEILEDGHIENKRINYCDVLFSDSSINKRNIYEVFFNKNNVIMVEGEFMYIDHLREGAKDFIENNGRYPYLSDNPQKAIILLSSERGTSYKNYIRVQNELTAAYTELRNKEALKNFGELYYANLSEGQKKEIRKMYPRQICRVPPNSNTFDPEAIPPTQHEPPPPPPPEVIEHIEPCGIHSGEAIEIINEDDDEVFMVVENMPEFPGGDLGLMKYIQQNVKYPLIAKEYNITGKVYVQFRVNKSGSVTNVKIVRSVDKNLDAEALRVVRSLPKYKPGKQRGKPVSVQYTIPINFTLN